MAIGCSSMSGRCRIGVPERLTAPVTVAYLEPGGVKDAFCNHFSPSTSIKGPRRVLLMTLRRMSNILGRGYLAVSRLYRVDGARTNPAGERRGRRASVYAEGVSETPCSRQGQDQRLPEKAGGHPSLPAQRCMSILRVVSRVLKDIVLLAQMMGMCTLRHLHLSTPYELITELLNNR